MCPPSKSSSARLKENLSSSKSLAIWLEARDCCARLWLEERDCLVYALPLPNSWTSCLIKLTLSSGLACLNSTFAASISFTSPSCVPKLSSILLAPFFTYTAPLSDSSSKHFTNPSSLSCVSIPASESLLSARICTIVPTAPAVADGAMVNGSTRPSYVFHSLEILSYFPNAFTLLPCSNILKTIFIDASVDTNAIASWPLTGIIVISLSNSIPNRSIAPLSSSIIGTLAGSSTLTILPSSSLYHIIIETLPLASSIAVSLTCTWVKGNSLNSIVLGSLTAGFSVTGSDTTCAAGASSTLSGFACSAFCSTSCGCAAALSISSFIVLTAKVNASCVGKPNCLTPES